MSRACDVRIACPAKGLQTQTFRSRQSYSPTCGYLPLNRSVQNLVLTRGPTAAAAVSAPGGSVDLGSRFPKPNMPLPVLVDSVRAAGGRTGTIIKQPRRRCQPVQTSHEKLVPAG